MTTLEDIVTQAQEADKRAGRWVLAADAAWAAKAAYLVAKKAGECAQTASETYKVAEEEELRTREAAREAAILANERYATAKENP